MRYSVGDISIFLFGGGEVGGAVRSVVFVFVVVVYRWFCFFEVFCYIFP